MQYLEVERLHIAINDEKILFKFLVFSDYMKVLGLMKEIGAYLQGISENTNNLIKDYNKGQAEPVVKVDVGMMTGPTDFIEKVNSLREQELAVKELNFLSDPEVFKSVVENAAPSNQLVLFQHLFKHT